MFKFPNFSSSKASFPPLTGTEVACLSCCLADRSHCDRGGPAGGGTYTTKVPIPHKTETMETSMHYCNLWEVCTEVNDGRACLEGGGR